MDMNWIACANLITQVYIFLFKGALSCLKIKIKCAGTETKETGYKLVDGGFVVEEMMHHYHMHACYRAKIRIEENES
jgi:hypothetical protein